MQDKDAQFDLLVRSMTENAEEEVPSRVWSVVSSRLDATSARRRKVAMWWRGAAVGLTAAAAVAVVAVIGFEEKPKVAGDVAVEATAQIGQAPETATNPDESIFSTKPTLVENKSTSSEAPAVIAAEPQSGTNTLLAEADASVRQSIGEEGEEIQASQEVLPVEKEETNVMQEKDGKAGQGNASVEEPWTDPFGLPEQGKKKGEKRASRFAMTMGGNVSTNGNAAALSGSRMMMSSGNYSSSNYEQVKRVSNEATYSVPVSFGVGVKMYLTDRFSVGLGLNYYLLRSTFTGSYQKVVDGEEIYNFTSDVHSSVHYLGVPLTLGYDFVQSNRASVYVHAGGTLEKGLTNRYRIEHSSDDIIYRESVDGVQYSLFAGVGVEFKLNDFMGIYVDPSLHWYPHCGQPFSIRTQQPLMFDLNLGLRVDF